MKFSEAWLREFVNPDLSTRELVNQLTMAGLEVKGVAQVAAEFDRVVVGEILEVNAHPDADRLVVCRVSSGPEEHQVVCGAPNARTGIKVPFALVGAALPDIKIGKARLRGVESHGMLCSERELGLGDNHEGLMELPLDAPVGEDLRSWLQVDDSIIEVDLTPNRGDCLSMIGLARETGLLNRLDVREPAQPVIAPAIDDTFPVELAAGAACPRFVGRVVRDINQQAETPLWMREKLRRAGLRSIDPVVDVTNYVMLELGQPLHAYDLEKLRGGILVRQSRAGEKLTLLDGSQIKTWDDTLLITDHSGPVGLAGVMGGLGTSVTDDTRHLFLEAAFFDPAAIAGRARLYGVHSDAAHRFERGVDWQGQVRAIERATELLTEIAGGEPGPVAETLDEAGLPVTKVVELRASRIARVLGIQIEEAEVDRILARLGFPTRTLDEDGEHKWIVSAPSHRFDIAIEADLVEEISRVYGYNKLPSRTPVTGLQMAPGSEAKIPLNHIKNQLVSRGYFEAVTYSFVDSALQTALDPENEPIALANPLSADMSVMRTTIWASLLKSLIYNLNRQQDRVRLFEAGLCFSRRPNRKHLSFADIRQVRRLAGVACGTRQEENWSNDPEPIDFYDIKGDLESLLAITGQPDTFEVIARQHPALHPGQSAAVRKNDEIIGHLGLLHPEIQRGYDIRCPVYLFELDVVPISDRKVTKSEAMSRFPEVRRDISILVDQTVSASALRQCIRASADDTLQNLKLFDVYQGKGIDPASKSIALGLTFRHASRTLTDAEINNSVAGIVASLEAEFGASLRDS